MTRPDGRGGFQCVDMGAKLVPTPLVLQDAQAHMAAFSCMTRISRARSRGLELSRAPILLGVPRKLPDASGLAILPQP
jgi:hypothetical protein